MKMTFGGYPLYAPDTDGQLYQHISKYIWPMLLSAPQSERGFIYSKACEPLEPLRTRQVTPCPPLNLYQMYYPWGWDNYARMWVLMRRHHFVHLTNGVPGDDVQLGPSSYPTFSSVGFPPDWSVYPFRCSWAHAAPIKSTPVPLPFGGFTFIFSGSIFSLEVPMIANRVVKVGAGIDYGSMLQGANLQNEDDEPPLDTVYLVELVDFRYKLRQQPAPHVPLNNPSWQQFVASITSGLPQLRQLLENPWSGTAYAPINALPSMPDMSQLNRPGTPVTKILDCLPTGITTATTRDLVPASEKPKRRNPLGYLDFDDPELNFVVENDTEVRRYKNLVVDYLFPRYINGRHHPELAPYRLAGEVYGNGEIERITMTSSQPAKFKNASDPCPYNLPELRLLAMQDSPLITRHLGETTSFPRRFAKDWLDFYLFDFISKPGPLAIRKNLSSTQYRLHSYTVSEQLPKACDDIRRIRLLENLPACSDAMAYILTDGDVLPDEVDCTGSGSGSSAAPEDKCPCNNERVVLVKDTAGIARTKISRVSDDGVQNSTRFAPANSMGFARPLRCEGVNSELVYELVSIGEGCCEATESGAEDCCEQWFTRFENLAEVTSKPLGSVIAYGESVGQAKPSGDVYIRYMAYLASSPSPPGCAIDLSDIHSFPTQNDRMEGSEPCENTYSQCSIDYAKSKMSGRLPVDNSCSWYEDLSQPVTGNYYYSRMLRTNPANCIYNKKVFNFTSVRTTLESVGPDYVVLKHSCPSQSSESSSGGGIDPCCVVLADYDVRCLGGRLQRWKKETEVCWDGECLVSRVVSDWANTGTDAGCCDCGSGSSSVGSSEGGGGGTGCIGGVTVVLPSTGFQSGGTMWDITSSSYDMSTGNWSVSAVANANAGTAPSCAANVSCTVQANAASNPAVTSCVPGSGLKCQWDTITISGTSTPPTSGNCGTWAIQAVVNNITFFDFSFDCAECISVGTCCSGLQLPPTLTAVITGGSSCDGTIILAYDGTAWRGGSLDLSCSGGTWYMQYESEAVSPTVTCSPFSAVGVFALGSTSCTGGFTVTITL